MYSSEKKLKKVFFALLTGLIAATVIVACSKEEEEDDDMSEILAATIHAKWVISTPNSDYTFFEFSKTGRYIAVDSNIRIIYFGTYRIDKSKIILNGCGTINAIAITNEKFTFSFTHFETGKINEYVANRAKDVIPSSNSTSMLCRTWVIDKVSIDENLMPEKNIADLINKYGENWKDIEEELLNEELVETRVYFSRAGTYLWIHYGDDSNDGEAILAEWKWVNKEETTFYYSKNKWTTSRIVQINELNDTDLILQEGWEIYHLSPVQQITLLQSLRATNNIK